MTAYPSRYYRNPEEGLIRMEEKQCTGCRYLWNIGNTRKCAKGKKATSRCAQYKETA